MNALGCSLNFSRLAVVTDQCTCQSLGRNSEHCQFESYHSTGGYVVFEREFLSLISLEEALWLQ